MVTEVLLIGKVSRYPDSGIQQDSPGRPQLEVPQLLRVVDSGPDVPTSDAWLLQKDTLPEW